MNRNAVVRGWTSLILLALIADVGFASPRGSIDWTDELRVKEAIAAFMQKCVRELDDMDSAFRLLRERDDKQDRTLGNHEARILEIAGRISNFSRLGDQLFTMIESVHSRIASDPQARGSKSTQFLTMLESRIGQLENRVAVLEESDSSQSERIELLEQQVQDLQHALASTIARLNGGVFEQSVTQETFLASRPRVLAWCTDLEMPTGLAHGTLYVSERGRQYFIPHRKRIDSDPVIVINRHTLCSVGHPYHCHAKVVVNQERLGNKPLLLGFCVTAFDSSNSQWHGDLYVTERNEVMLLAHLPSKPTSRRSLAIR